MTDPSSSIKALAQLLQHQFKILDDALLKVSHDKNEEGGDETTLNQLVANPDLSSAVFPVYGVVKAGKSTFFACLIGEKVLPEQAAPMTSIPIRIKHVKGIPQKRLIMPQYERWNRCVAGFRQKLLSGTLDAEILDPSRKGESNGGGNDVALFKIQEEIRAKKVSFCAEATGDAIRVSADAISHFVRLLWFNNIDFESDYEISLNIDDLPTIEISMKAFESYGDKSFSLLDTPGQNEARASEALMKLGPQIMKHSSGCILCVPWQQVDATQQMPVFDYVNRSMRGKRVIVIVTLWDSFKDTAADAPQNMIDNILSYFNTDMRPNVTIHLTSGHKMLCFMKLERLLLEHEALGSNEATLLSAVGESDFAIDLSNPVTGGGYLSRSLWSKQSFLDFVSNTRTELKSEEVIQSFRTLYDEAELLAIQGHIATLDSAHSRWLKSFETLKLFVSSSGEKREAIQKKLLQTSETYKAVVDEMSSLPGKVTDAVRNHLNELIGKGLMTFAESMRNWKVVIERSDGSIEEREEISFPGGKAEVRMWIESPRCKGKLVSFMKQPTKLQLEAARSCLPGVIKEMYTKCGDLVEMISTVSDGTADAMRDMQIFFRKIPVVDFNVDLYVDTVCQMDAKQITFREERSHCVIVNETFKIEVYDLFKRSFQDAISLISATIFSDLDHIFTDFSKLVSTELQTVEKIYMRNQEFLQQQLDAADLEQILTSVDRDNTVFTDDLMELKKSLLHPPGSASTSTPTPAHPSAAAASVPNDSTTLPPPPELVPSLNRQLSFIGKIVSIRNVERDSYLSQDISLNLSVSSSPSVDFCKWCLETSTDGSLTVMNSQTEQYLLADCDYLSLSHEGDVISEPNSKMLWSVIPNTDSQHDSFSLTPALRPGMWLTLDEFGNLVLVNYASPAGFWTIAVAE